MIAIRRAGQNDLGPLYHLYSKIGQKDPGCFEKCLDQGWTIYIASLSRHPRRVNYAAQNPGGDGEGETAGFCIYCPDPKYTLYKKLGIPEIQDLNVVPEVRRQGIATRLIEECENRAREEGAEQIGISVGLTRDYGQAQRLYVKLGYMPDGFGVTYQRELVDYGQRVAVDDDLCMMKVKSLQKA